LGNFLPTANPGEIAATPLSGERAGCYARLRIRTGDESDLSTLRVKQTVIHDLAVHLELPVAA
jgi:hypothetical protein